jgi:hypothetical protein
MVAGASVKGTQISFEAGRTGQLRRAAERAAPPYLGKKQVGFMPDTRAGVSGIKPDLQRSGEAIAA